VQSVDNQIRIVRPVSESDKTTDEDKPAEAES
jgi:hypothetical protein